MDVTGSESRRCGQLHEVISRVGERWTLPVAFALRDRPMRFNALRRAVPRISQQMLTRTLRALERDGMASRTVFPSVPPQVEYALTPLGQSLVAEALRLGAWAEAHVDEIDLNRTAYDRGELESERRS